MAIVVRVLRGVLMPLAAVGLNRIPVNAPIEVFPTGDWLKMGWVDTGSIAAQVV